MADNPFLDDDTGDLKSGLYDYLQAKAQRRAQTNSPAAYQAMQDQGTQAAQEHARNTMLSGLSDMSSMVGNLYGQGSKTIPLQGMADSLHSADQEDLANQYKVHNVENTDTDTDLGIAKFGNDIQRQNEDREYKKQALYANLQEKRLESQARLGETKTMHDLMRQRINETGRHNEAMEGKNLEAWRIIPDKQDAQGNPLMMNPKTGEIRGGQLPTGFKQPEVSTSPDGEVDSASNSPLGIPYKNAPDIASGAAPMPQDQQGAAARKSAIETDRPMDKISQKRFNDVADSMNPGSVRARNDIKKQQDTITASNKMLQLGEQGNFQKNGLSRPQVHEAAIASAALVSGGTGAAQATIDALVPHSYAGDAAGLESWLSNEPKGANQMEFVRQMMETARREKALSSETIKSHQADILASSPDLWKKYPGHKQYLQDYHLGPNAKFDKYGHYQQSMPSIQELRGQPAPQPGAAPNPAPSQSNVRPHDQPVGATRQVGDQTYVKTPQGWVPQSGASQ